MISVEICYRTFQNVWHFHATAPLTGFVPALCFQVGFWISLVWLVRFRYLEKSLLRLEVRVHEWKLSFQLTRTEFYIVTKGHFMLNQLTLKMDTGHGLC